MKGKFKGGLSSKNDANKHKLNIVQQYFETILEIIEDKPNFVIPYFVYCTLVATLVIQIAGYVFSTFEDKPMLDPRAAFIAQVNEVDYPIQRSLLLRA